MFSEGPKPLEVEILVAQLGNKFHQTKLYQVAYEGTISDEEHFAILGGRRRAVKARYAALRSRVRPWPRRFATRSARSPVPIAPFRLTRSKSACSRIGGRRTFVRLHVDVVSEILAG